MKILMKPWLLSYWLKMKTTLLLQRSKTTFTLVKSVTNLLQPIRDKLNPNDFTKTTSQLYKSSWSEEHDKTSMMNGAWMSMQSVRCTEWDSPQLLRMMNGRKSLRRVSELTEQGTLRMSNYRRFLRKAGSYTDNRSSKRTVLNCIINLKSLFT